MNDYNKAINDVLRLLSNYQLMSRTSFGDLAILNAIKGAIESLKIDE